MTRIRPFAIAVLVALTAPAAAERIRIIAPYAEVDPPASMAPAPVPAAPATAAVDAPSEVASAIARAIEAADLTRLSASERRVREALHAAYAERGHRPVFGDEAGFSARARAAIDVFANAKRDGLNPADYVRAAFADTGRTAEAAARRDLAMADALVAYARHASGGRVDPARVHARHVTVRPPMPEVGEVLQAFESDRPIASVLDGFHPPHEGFRALRRALAALLDAAPASSQARGPLFPGGPALRVGMSDPRVPLLRERLAHAAPAGSERDTMDPGLAAAVRLFQSAQGLEPTGIVGPRTAAALNVDVLPRVERQAADLIANMERWRWLPRELGGHHVWVNIPEYLVRVRSGGTLTFEGRVVVGKDDTPTPIFSDEMQFIVVNPSWTVPPTIVRNQMMPLLRSNPEALARRGIEVVRGRNGQVMFRQPPGERNALGRVKFMFPNDHAVYLHDTPARGYFSHARRAYSHGCVRVEHPARFADAAFAMEDNLGGRRIEQLYGPSERTVRLRNRFPIHLVYFTRFERPDGSIGQAEDIYGFHERLKALLGLS